MSRAVARAERKTNDYYPSPPWTVHRLIERVPLPPGTWCEPAAGDGGIILACHEAGLQPDGWVAIDVADCVRRVDQLRGVVGCPIETLEGDCVDQFAEHSSLLEDISVVITNPPYSRALEFVEWSLALESQPLVVMLLRLDFLSGASRAAFMRTHAPDVYVLPNRPQFTATGSDHADYAWFTWPDGNRYRPRGRLEVLRETPAAERARDRRQLLLTGAR
jgi:hypothetical protein